MPLSAGKNKKYTGPNNHNAIITRINQEAKERGHKLSRKEIERSVKLFFAAHGLLYHFRLTRNFYVKGLGFFIIGRKFKSKLQVKKNKRKNFKLAWDRAKRRKQKAQNQS